MRLGIEGPEPEGTCLGCSCGFLCLEDDATAWVDGYDGTRGTDWFDGNDGVNLDGVDSDGRDDRIEQMNGCGRSRDLRRHAGGQGGVDGIDLDGDGGIDYRGRGRCCRRHVCWSCRSNEVEEGGIEDGKTDGVSKDVVRRSEGRGELRHGYSGDKGGVLRNGRDLSRIGNEGGVAVVAIDAAEVERALTAAGELSVELVDVTLGELDGHVIAEVGGGCAVRWP